ncbi:hypothetical protein DESPIG_02513 [Desulfovibrio piger ATCC 29098]|uniref:Uncharacterized protein n=1 Tax=Desulfovibrio piger ATCC 29098 TaxID=411464 RepID=B6WWP4_9BACT|nr:hypothetical protein DESPIG_02513 [Desulfovibrio piger ATCC 29098]
MSSRALPPRDYYARTGGKVNCPGAAVRPGRQGGQALPGRASICFLDAMCLVCNVFEASFRKS